MEYDALVRQIVERVAEQMARADTPAPVVEDKPALLVLTQRHGEHCHPVLEDPSLLECYRTCCALAEEYRCDPADFEAVILFDLTVDALGKLATGACDTPYTALAARAILLGKKIFVPREEIELCRYEATAPPAYLNVMRAQLKLLEDSGLVVCSLKELVGMVLDGDDPTRPAAPARAPACKEICIGKRVVTERDITEADMAGAGVVRVACRAILTDLAKDLARTRGIQILRDGS